MHDLMFFPSLLQTFCIAEERLALARPSTFLPPSRTATSKAPLPRTNHSRLPLFLEIDVFLVKETSRYINPQLPQITECPRDVRLARRYRVGINVATKQIHLPRCRVSVELGLSTVSWKSGGKDVFPLSRGRWKNNMSGRRKCREIHKCVSVVAEWKMIIPKLRWESRVVPSKNNSFIDLRILKSSL
jgi:hypothetical protein